MAEAVAEEYRSSLVDLNFNSKPHINMLTIIAEENVKYAPMIVDTILTHIKSVPPDLKLPSLYLVDSIMKNIGGQYITLFSKHMITLFSSVFEKVEETTRSALYKLRQTWNDILPKNVLYGVDLKVNSIDPAWPITAVVAAPVSSATAAASTGSSTNQIHINPKFLGGPSAPQNPNAVKSQEKPAAIVKSEPILKDKDTEVMEMKKKQEEMLKLIEEKKTQLKALEQKKLEMAAKQKKPAVLATPAPTKVAPQVHSQKKFVNHRDPRLKKSMTFVQTPTDIKVPEKASAVSLQSVVVVPNSKLPPDAINGSVPSTSAIKTKEEKPIVNNTLHAQEQSTPHKGLKTVDKSSKGSPKDKNNPPKEILNKNFKNSKKHSTSPENKLGVNAKRFCKQPVGKQKRTHFQESDFQHTKNEPHPTKKQKNEISKSKNKANAGVHNSEERISEYTLFGIEDKDYRHQVRSDDRSKHGPQSQTKSVHTTNPRVPLEIFNAKDHNSTVLPLSTTERNPIPQKTILPESIAEPNLIVKQTFVETYRPEIDQKIKQESRIIEGNPIKVENFDRNYTSVPVVAKGRIHPPSTSSIMLDGKNRVVHFVNERAVTVMDNNEPREVNFAGPPRNVYIEGLPHPLLLEFGGRQVDFNLDGKRNVVRFGAPSREIYINNFPYEAKFGGPHFTALLEDQKEHKVRIDGPPPQVMISEKPAYDLFEHFNPNTNIKKEPEDASLLQDVDMRLKPSHLLQPSLLPECKKDVDWRHVASSSDATQIPWNVPQNSFETYNDVPGARSFAPGVSSITAPMEYPNSNSNPMIAQRNNTMNHSTWPHPAYREVAPPNERPVPMHMDQQSQHIPSNTAWELKTPTTLPPPPSIPPSLNLSTQSANLSGTGQQLPSLQSMSQLPNMSIPPPSWNPLPPPPMFTGAVPDTVNRQAILPNPVPELEPVVSLPVNVNTIYQKLIAAGIIPNKKAEEPQLPATETPTKDEKPPEEAKEEEEIEIPDIRLTPKSLRQFNPAVIAMLYKGSQCATCGMRFKEIQSQQYSRHLDWHFRMNRREKDGAKKAYSRRLYYEIKDWIQFKEIEEAEERMPSYFELQTDGETSKNDEKEKIQSVPASECESEKCSVCGEQFQLFWVEEEEEWHLKHAVRHDGEAYHPMCYEDHKKAIETANREPEVPEDNLADSIKAESEEPMAVDNETPEAIKDEKEIKEEDIKEEKEDSPNDDHALPEATKSEEKSEIPAPESPKDKVPEENAVSINEDAKGPIEEKETTTEMEVDQVESTASATECDEADKITEDGGSSVTVEEDDDSGKVVEEDNSGKVVEEDNSGKVAEADISAKVSVPESVKPESEGSTEEEFRPPTPDPRFEVLAPVFKGTELSALCTIM